MKHGRIGDYVKVLEGCGLDSGKTGKNISFERYKALGGDMNDFLLWRNKGAERKTIVFVEPDSGKPFVMFKHSVEKIPTHIPKEALRRMRV